MKLVHSYSSIKLFELCPYRYYRQRITKDITDEGTEVSKHGERVHSALENRLKGEELPKEAVQYEPLCRSVEKLAEKGELYTEKELALNDELKPTGWWDPDIWLRSKLDVLIVAGPTAIVMDWKTGKRRPDFLQMDIFAGQVFKHYPEVNKIKTCLTWLKDMSMDTKEYTREDSNKLWEGILTRIRRIYKAVSHDVWPARPSGLCKTCPVRHDCDSAML